MRLSLSLAVAVVGLCAAGAAAQHPLVENVEVEVVPLGDADTLEVTSRSGAVHIDVGSEPEMRVRIVRRASGFSEGTSSTCVTAQEVALAHKGRKIELDWKWARGYDDACVGAVDFHVTVPAHVKIKIRGTDGDIAVHGIGADLDVRTERGNITIDCGIGDVAARSDHGQVEVHAASRKIDLRAENGPIRARLHAVGELDGEIRSDLGAVTVSLAPSVSTRLDCKIKPGPIKNTLTLVNIEQDLDDGTQELEGYHGGGKGKLKIRTEAGGLTLQPY